MSVPGLMRELLDCPVPSTAAGEILRQLARGAVCGITLLHQDQASAVYEKWCAQLFADFLAANGVRRSDIGSTSIGPVGDASWWRWFELISETLRPVVVTQNWLVLPEGDDMQLSEEELVEGVLDNDAGEGIEDDLHEGEGEDDRNQADEEEDEDNSHAESDVSVFSMTDTSNHDVTAGTVVDASDIPSSGSSGQVESSPEPTTQVAAITEDLGGLSDDEVMYTPAESEDEEAPESNLNPNLLLPLSQNDSQESGEEPPTTPASISPIGFRPYSNVQDQPRLLKELLHKLTQTVSTKKLHAGYIYAFRRPNFPGFLKVGYAKIEESIAGRGRAVPDPVDRRLAAWATRCGYVPELVFRVQIPHAVERTERLVHKTLQVERRVEDPPCARCRGRHRCRVRHNEWFEVGEAHARRVVNLWRQFGEACPYDGFGRLNSSWSSLVADERGRVAGTSTMMDWVERMPSHVERSAVELTGRLSMSNATLGNSYRYDWQFILALLAFTVNASPFFNKLPHLILAVLRLCLSFHFILQFQFHS
jgi:hypothetical protein